MQLFYFFPRSLCWFLRKSWQDICQKKTKQENYRVQGACDDSELGKRLDSVMKQKLKRQCLPKILSEQANFFACPEVNTIYFPPAHLPFAELLSAYKGTPCFFFGVPRNFRSLPSRLVPSEITLWHLHWAGIYKLCRHLMRQLPRGVSAFFCYLIRWLTRRWILTRSVRTSFQWACAFPKVTSAQHWKLIHWVTTISREFRFWNVSEVPEFSWEIIFCLMPHCATFVKIWWRDLDVLSRWLCQNAFDTHETDMLAVSWHFLCLCGEMEQQATFLLPNSFLSRLTFKSNPWANWFGSPNLSESMRLFLWQEIVLKPIIAIRSTITSWLHAQREGKLRRCLRSRHVSHIYCGNKTTDTGVLIDLSHLW